MRSQITEQLLSVENMTSIAKGKGRMPEVDGDGTITIDTSEIEGSFHSPCCNNSLDLNNKPQSLHYVVRLPENIQDRVGEGYLKMSVITQDDWTFMLAEKRFHLHKRMNWNDAKKHCVSQRGHLASISSKEQNDEAVKVADGKHIWLGGKRKNAKHPWLWSDNTTWDFQNWASHHHYTVGHCMRMDASSGRWYTGECSDHYNFLCSNPPQRKSGDYTFELRNKSLRNPIFQTWLDCVSQLPQGKA